MERRVPPASRKIHGATLAVSTMGGYSVTLGDEYLGYLHASVGGKFNTYRRKTNQLDDHLGKFVMDDAVLAILRACGKAIPEHEQSSP